MRETFKVDIATPEQVDLWHPSVRYICPACDEGLVTHNPRAVRCYWHGKPEAYGLGWRAEHYTKPVKPKFPSPEAAKEGWIFA